MASKYPNLQQKTTILKLTFLCKQSKARLTTEARCKILARSAPCKSNQGSECKGEFSCLGARERSAHLPCLGGVNQQQSKASTTAAAAGGEGAEGPPARGQIHQDARTPRLDATAICRSVISHSLSLIRGTHHTHQITMILGLRQHFLLDTEGHSLLSGCALHPARIKKEEGSHSAGEV